MSYLKEEGVLIGSLDKVLTLVELNALGQREMMKAHAEADMVRSMAVAVKYGTKDFREKTTDEIMDMMSLRQLQEIAERVSDLSGLNEEEAGNSDSDRIVGSSSA